MSHFSENDLQWHLNQLLQLPYQECFPNYDDLNTNKEIFDKICTPKLSSEFSLDQSSRFNCMPHEQIMIEDTSDCQNVNPEDYLSREVNNSRDGSCDSRVSVSSFSESGSVSLDRTAQRKLVWIDQSSAISLNGSEQVSGSNNPNSSSEEIEGVRKRLEKRKRRGVTKSDLSENTGDAKRMKNTIAARKYRQRRVNDIEILDKKVKELESELTTAKLETKWWQMEAQRWRELAEKRDEK